MDYISQTELATSDAFIHRVCQAIVKAAIAIANEAPTANLSLDNGRLALCAQVLRDPHRYARLFALGVVTDAAIKNAAPSDTDIYNVIAGQWNAYAGIKPAS